MPGSDAGISMWWIYGPGGVALLICTALWSIAISRMNAVQLKLAAVVAHLEAVNARNDNLVLELHSHVEQCNTRQSEAAAKREATYDRLEKLRDSIGRNEVSLAAVKTALNIKSG